MWHSRQPRYWPVSVWGRISGGIGWLEKLAGGKLEKHGVKFFYETRAVAEALEVFFELAGEA